MTSLHGSLLNRLLMTLRTTPSRPLSAALTDCLRFSSHIQHQLLPLLDLNLYISSLNYPLTRKAWTQILSFPSQYQFVPSRRTRARQRTAHLNLAALDLDTPREEQDQDAKQASGIPEHLRSIIKPSVSSLLRRSAASDRFRLESLVDAALEPLSELLSSKRWFLSDDGPSTLDALALGYLSLAVTPDLPTSWLKECIENKYANLKKFVDRGIQEIYGGTTSVEEALFTRVKTKLPWRTPAPIMFGQRVTSTMNTFWKQLPLPYNASDDSYAVSSSVQTRESPGNISSTARLPVIAVTASLTAAAAIAAYYFGFGFGLNNAPQEKKLSDLGEAGMIFSGIDLGSPHGGMSNENDRVDLAHQPSPAQSSDGKLEVTGIGIATETD